MLVGFDYTEATAAQALVEENLSLAEKFCIYFEIDFPAGNFQRDSIPAVRDRLLLAYYVIAHLRR